MKVSEYDNISKDLIEVEMVIKKVLTNSEVLSVLSTYGYTNQKLTSGLKVLENFKLMVSKQNVEYTVKYEHTKNTDILRQEANSLYSPMVKIARIAFRENMVALQELTLVRQRKKSLSDWITQTEIFYSILLSSKEYKNIIGKYGFTEEKIKAGKNKLNVLIKSVETQQKQMSEAVLFKKTKNKKLQELKNWIIDFREVIEIAFSADPKLLEILRFQKLD